MEKLLPGVCFGTWAPGFMASVFLSSVHAHHCIWKGPHGLVFVQKEKLALIFYVNGLVGAGGFKGIAHPKFIFYPFTTHHFVSNLMWNSKLSTVASTTERCSCCVHKISENAAQLPVFSCSRRLLCVGYLRERERERRRAACAKLFWTLQNIRNEKMSEVECSLYRILTDLVQHEHGSG